MAHVLFFILLTFAGLNCANYNNKNVVSIAPFDRDSILTLGASLIRIPIKPEAIKRVPGKVTVRIKEVVNPNLSPVSVKLYFMTEEKNWDIALFTLYPPDQPGTFVFRTNLVIEKMLKELKNDKNDEVFFCLQLQNEKNLTDTSLLIKLSEPVFGNIR